MTSSPRPALKGRRTPPAAQRRQAALVLAIFLISGSALAFEIALTRIFSLLFQYHYAFLAVSTAILGLGLGALLGRLLAPRYPQQVTYQPLWLAALALSLAFPLAAMGMAWFPSVDSILPHTFIALIPFILVGFVSALIFIRFPNDSGLLYGADLVGAAVGVVAVLGLLTLWSAFSVVIFLGGVAGLAAFALILSDQGTAPANPKADRRNWAGASLALLLSLGALALNLSSGTLEFSPAHLASASRDKTMINVLLDPSQAARIVYTAWDPFARVDVVETNDPSTKYVFTDGGAGSFMLHFNGDEASVAGWRDSVEYLPFAVGPAGQTLILGAGAGRDVVLAVLAGSQSITAVEVNPAMVAATRRFGEYNGRILDRPEVKLVVGDARTYVERSLDQYDLIYLNLVYSQAANPASQALVENYIFTREAFRAYLRRLRPGGHLAIISHNALEGSRAALTALQAMKDDGLSPAKALDHLALLMVYNQDPTQRVTMMLFGKDPLTAAELAEMTQGIQRVANLQSLFMPGGFELPFQSLRTGAETIDKFVSADPTYNLAPTNDDRPFFFMLDPGLPLPVVQAGLGAGLLALALLALTLLATRQTGSGWRWIGIVVYVALIGIGFMLVEVPLIQRFQLLLGYPVLSIITVLGALLLAGGLGSLVSQRWPAEGLLRRVIIAAVWVGLVAGLYWLVLPTIVRNLLAAPLELRVLAAIGLTALLGFPMGIPFPSILRVAGNQYQRNVALLWGVNGAFSVLGSTGAIILSMNSGFSWTLAAGIVAYGLVAVLAWRLQS
jgi:predicted membrane-bound spermidine synthase